MTRDEIVAALRCCEDQDKKCSDCAFLLVSNCVESMNNRAADLIENQQNHIAALMQANDSLKDAIARRDKQIEDMKQGMAQYEDTGYTPEEIAKLQGDLIQRNAELLKARENAHAMRNELCGRCGSYLYEHNGACDGCRWREK